MLKRSTPTTRDIDGGVTDPIPLVTEACPGRSLAPQLPNGQKSGVQMVAVPQTCHTSSFTNTLSNCKMVLDFMKKHIWLKSFVYSQFCTDICCVFCDLFSLCINIMYNRKLAQNPEMS